MADGWSSTRSSIAARPGPRYRRTGDAQGLLDRPASVVGVLRRGVRARDAAEPRRSDAVQPADPPDPEDRESERGLWGDAGAVRPLSAVDAAVSPAGPRRVRDRRVVRARRGLGARCPRHLPGAGDQRSTVSRLDATDVRAHRMERAVLQLRVSRPRHGPVSYTHLRAH